MTHKIETYKGFTIRKSSLFNKWNAYDADGIFFDSYKTKAVLKAGIAAYVRGEKWAVNDAIKMGYLSKDEQ